MNLRNIINRILGREEPRKLRNKPGGMAWITARVDEGEGARALVGRAVRTVALEENGLWAIDPEQSYVATHRAHNVNDGYHYWPGSVITVIGIRDESLEPWKEDGVTDSEVERLYKPAANSEREILTLPVREMIAPEVVQAVSHLLYQADDDAGSALRAASDPLPQTNSAAAHTGQGRPL